MNRRIAVTVRPDGSISAEISGTPGPECMDAIPQLIAMSGANITDSRPTPEFTQVHRATSTEYTQNRLEDQA